jgi:hypothetical protein
MNDCLWKCKDKPSNSIQRLSNCEWICNTGFYHVGENCSLCTNKPLNSYYIGHATIEFEYNKPALDEKFLIDGQELVAFSDLSFLMGLREQNVALLDMNGKKTTNCSWICNVGYYAQNLDCIPCANKPPNSVYIKANSTQNDCYWKCNAGYYKNESLCQTCTNKALNSTYTDTENLTPECDWKCDIGLFKGLGKNTKHSCHPCPPNTNFILNTTERTLKACTCNAGFTCTYSARVTGTIHLNLPLSYLTSEVRRNLINAIAKASFVKTSQITIDGVRTIQDENT